MGLIKRVYTDEETLITAKNLNDIQDAVIGLEDGLFTIDNDKSGEVITITNAYKRGFRSLSIYGKTTQDGTPTPDNPVDLVNVGDSGSITVNVLGNSESQSMTIATPNGLPGIPVTKGGNYTDVNGQQWFCDEIDFARGVYVQRVGNRVFDGSADESWHSAEKTETWDGVYHIYLGIDTPFGAYSSHYAYLDKPASAYVENRGRFDITYKQFRVNAYGFAGVEAFRSFLSTNPLSLMTPLATPIETPLTEEELAAYAALHTYKDSTTVSNDAGAWMELEYVMDSKKYIDGLITGVVIPATVE